MPDRRFAFEQWDVFTQVPLAGNPLAIFADSSGLRDEDLQRLARETNHSETTFVLRRPAEVEQQQGISMRIFTPEKELPFAGHPVLGTALMLRGDGNASEMIFDLKIGRVRVQFEKLSTGQIFAEMLQPEPSFIASVSSRNASDGLGLSIEDFEPDMPIEIVSTGLPYLIVPLRSLERVSMFRPNWMICMPFLASLPQSPSLYLVTRETSGPPASLHCRCLDPEREDPATGSAAGCAAAWMLQYGFISTDERVVLEQGLEIGRPSQLFVRAAKRDKKISSVRVGGHAVQIMRGEYLLSS